jgi:hypothetical protein
LDFLLLAESAMVLSRLVLSVRVALDLLLSLSLLVAVSQVEDLVRAAALVVAE